MKKVIRNKKGFTLAETLLAATITLMVAGLLAGGIPLALNAYHKIVDSANANVVIATLTTELRDELALANDVTANGSSLTYTNKSGRNTNLYKKDDGIYLKDTKSNNEALLLSKASMANNLYVAYDSVAFSNDMITFTNLKVCNSDSVLVSLDEYKIRVLSN